MKMFKKMKKGFTLVELIIVMVILGALAAIAIPKMSGSTDGAILASVKSDLRTAIAKANEYYSKNLTYEGISVDNLGVVPSPGNQVELTVDVHGNPVGLWVHRDGEDISCNISLEYNYETGIYFYDGEESTSMPKITCNNNNDDGD